MLRKTENSFDRRPRMAAPRLLWGSPAVQPSLQQEVCTVYAGVLLASGVSCPDISKAMWRP